MEAIKLLLSTRRNIITLLIIAVLAVGLVVGIRLVQQQTQLKSKAATALEGQIWNIEPNPVNKVGGNWQQMTISVGANDQNWQLLYYNPGTCSPGSCPLVGWTVIGTGNDDKTITWNPPTQFTAGVHSLALFDGNATIVDVKDARFSESPPAFNADIVSINFKDVVSGINGSYTDFPGGLLVNHEYQVTITMENTNLGNTQHWGPGFKLQFIDPTNSVAGLLNLNPVSIAVDRDVGPDNTFPFVAKIKPSIERDYAFHWYMQKPDNTQFGAEVNIEIHATQAPAGGIGTCPVGTSVIIPDEPTVTRVWKCTDQTSSCRAQGIPPNNYTCAGSSETCLACSTTPVFNNFPFSQCGSCKNNPKTQAQDPNCEDPSAIRDDDPSKCTRTREIDSDRVRDKCIEFKCEGASKRRDCEICWGGQSCELRPTLCSDPAKPFCETSQPQRGFCTAGPAASPSPSASPPACVVSQGDADKDGDVDLSDFNLWFRELHSLTQSKKADFNCDGAVNTVDFSIWKNGYL